MKWQKFKSQHTKTTFTFYLALIENNLFHGTIILFIIYELGKTYIWRAISVAIRSKGETVLTVASSGIASLLIPGGEQLILDLQLPLILMRILPAI